MRTSKAKRLEEWLRLGLKAANGRLHLRTQINRWRQLKAEFQPTPLQTGLSRLKTIDNQ